MYISRSIIVTIGSGRFLV